MTTSSIQLNRSRVMMKRAENVLYLFLFLLPIIWIQNKTVQMAIEIGVVILMMVIEKKPNIYRITIPVLFYTAVHIVSILYNICINKEPINNVRIIAAFNTAFVWILGCIAFSLVARIKLNDRTIIRLMSFLYWVIIFESVLAIVLWRINVYLGINGRSLFFIEWFNGGNRIRSFCWMEYASLVPFLLFCVLPYVYIGINGRKPLIRIAVMALSFLPLYLCNSRLGMVLVLALVGYMSIIEMWKHKVLRVALLAICFLLIAFVFIKMEFVISKIISIFEKLLFGRESSNITRMTLYSSSWEKIKASSLLFGAGIKHITVIPDIPLGSHSTYLGAIYKAGFLGAAFLFCFFGNITKKICRKVQKKKLNSIFLVSLFGVFALMTMEDIDGANWMHFFFFIDLGIIFNMGKERQSVSHAGIDNNATVFSPWRCDQQCGT